MTAKPPHPFSGVKLFTVTAVDGRKVSLHEDWYFAHILNRKPEIGWLTDAVEAIKQALIRAEEVKLDHISKRPLYIGPVITGGFGGPSRLHVAVEPRGTRGVVITVIRVFGD